MPACQHRPRLRPRLLSSSSIGDGNYNAYRKRCHWGRVWVKMPAGQIISFPWTETALDIQVRAAVASLWTGREEQGRRQTESGQQDAGTRGNVTGGRHLNGFCLLLRELARAAGFSDDEIRTRTGLALARRVSASRVRA